MVALPGRRVVYVDGASAVGVAGVVVIAVVAKGMADGDAPSMCMRDRVAHIVAATIAVVLAGIDVLDHRLGIRAVVGLDRGGRSGRRGGEYWRRVRQSVKVGTLSCPMYSASEDVSITDVHGVDERTRCTAHIRNDDRNNEKPRRELTDSGICKYDKKTRVI